ncbi:hypothetical protein RB653_009699 [Dictyostelium firmibasis]|uniref:GRIP domain-containing protein n=1 Tax=Dictyostelium firmibasis TaxID=79012 RepID=A0AAN7TKF6_9MYCE
MTSNKNITSNNNNNNNNNINNNNNNNNSGGGGSNFGFGWVSTFSDQLNQIKDVMTSEGGYEDEDRDEGEEDEVFVLRAETLKYKQDITQLEQRILEFEQREVNISKEYSLILKEKNSEISDLKSINENLKSSLISPKQQQQQQKTQLNNSNQIITKDKNEQFIKHDNESLGIPLEDDDFINKDDNDNILKEQFEKNKEDYQIQILSIQEAHQEKLYDLTMKIEQLEQKILTFDDEKLKIETEKTQLQTINENFKKQNQTFSSTIKELNEKIDQLSTTTTIVTSTTDILNSGGEKQQDNIEQQTQIITLKEQVNKSNKELARLRQHLIDMEDQHTTIDLENEERISQLEQLLNKSNEQNINNQLINEQINKLGKDLIEKDEQLRQSDQQLMNLNNVLEQFQADQEVTIQNEVIHLQQKLEQYTKEIESLKKDQSDYIALQKKYSNSQDQIQLLYQDIQSKTFDFIKLKEDIEPLKVAFDKTILRLGDMCLQEQESVDKRVVSKLFLNYFSGNKKTEILELIAKILNFSDAEKISIGLTKKGQWSLLPPFFGSRDGNNQEVNDGGEKPLAEMWIEFLLKESSGENNINTLSDSDIVNGNQSNNNSNSNNSINHYSLSNPTPFSTPVKPSFQQPSSPPTTPYKTVNNNYFSVTPGKQKTTVIFDGDMNDKIPFK